MKYIICLSFILFSEVALSSSYISSTYQVEFSAYLTTEMDDIDHAIKRQVNHTLGPSTLFKSVGKRSSLGHNYKTEILEVRSLEGRLKRVDYKYYGTLLVEKNVNLESYKVVAPIRARIAFEKARGRCSNKSSLAMFYQKWSPSFRRCPLQKGVDYEEFKLTSFSKIDEGNQHLTKELLVNGEYNLYYYTGSDYHSLRRFGFADDAASMTIRLFKKKGFKVVSTKDSLERIFNKTRLRSRFTKLEGKINEKTANIYVLLGNPTDETPEARYEFFKFFKHAFKNASAIQYNGHAGLGAVLDFDYLEQEYKEKIEYNLNQKQLLYLNGCGTFLHSTGFFFKKKYLSNSLVLITNGLSILTKYNKAPSLLIGHTLLSKERFTNTELRSQIERYMKADGAMRTSHAMVAVESN